MVNYSALYLKRNIIYLINLVSSADADVLFCEFHREQAWSRWAKAHHLSADLTCLLDTIALAATETDFDIAVKDLQESPLYTQEVENWFRKSWLNHAKVT
jgi:hypothetical protein